MNILGIETSCDETAAAIVSKQDKVFKVVSETVLSQIDTHAKYGGVVPEVAARKHIVNIIPVISETLQKAQMNLSDIDRIAVTQGPGLMSSLLVGLETAKALTVTSSIPIVGVNHLEGHVVSNLLDNPDISYPALCLIISGGHTQFVKMVSQGNYEIIGRTVDDACGECFDKVAKMLDLGYPGGPAIQEMAKHGNENAIDFPRPMIDSDDLQMSFSGLKTAVKYYIRDVKIMDEKKKQDICASFQKSISEVLIAKTKKAIQDHGIQNMMLAGGASANKKIREEMGIAMKDLSIPLLVPDLKYCMDNAVMIALAGHFKNPLTDISSLEANPNLNV